MITIKAEKFSDKFDGYQGCNVYYIENGTETVFGHVNKTENLNTYLNGIKQVLNHLGKEFEIKSVDIEWL